jgi:hypothetical protein
VATRKPGRPARSSQRPASRAPAAAAGTGSTIPMVKPAGVVRRSQVISTYGIGAIIDLEAGSFMPLGLSDWEAATRPAALIVYEPRLQAQLGVDHFRLPPVAQSVDGYPGHVESRATLPAVRFPEWHECPKCHRLGVEGNPFEVSSDGNSLECPGCRATANPVRFVVACLAGHIDEFPWKWWAHRRREAGTCANPVLSLKSHGESASLADLYVFCAACKAASSLGDAFLKDILKGVGCSGRRPWLVDRQDCNVPPRVLQRGASNVHFPVVASALSIPPTSEPLFQILEDRWDTISSLPADAVEPVLRKWAGMYRVSEDELLAAYARRRMLQRAETEYTDLTSRSEEYLALSATREDEPLAGFVSQFRNLVAPAPQSLASWFDLVGAGSRLREVRVMAGLTRIEPYPVSGERIARSVREGRVAPISRDTPRWLPAAEIRGEGIFIRFRSDAIDGWVQNNPSLKERAAALDARADAMAFDRGYQRDYRITPRLLLTHSFAHAMIRQLSIDCGYSSSALRERLYVAEGGDNSSAMNGVLIYTGSPDSEGSLGGLVRLADPELITDAVTRAVRNSRWCGSDPVCIEMDPAQSGERISGAACHCCLLVPETACEKYNRELDRSMLVGDAAGRWKGFFDGLGES